MYSEFTGVVLSPDGRTLYADIQDPGLMLAVTGPWKRLPRWEAVVRPLPGVQAPGAAASGVVIGRRRSASTPSSAVDPTVPATPA